MYTIQKQLPQGIIISVDFLNRQVWGSICQFIDHCYTNSELKDFGLDIYWTDSATKIQFDPRNKIDLGNTNFNFTKETKVAILYNKSDGHDDFDHIFSFLMLEKKFSGKIVLGINLNNIEYQKASDYRFRLAAFTSLSNNKSIRLLLKENIIDKKTGEETQIDEQRVLRPEDVARTYLPLCKITKTTYDQLFVKQIHEVEKVIDGNEEERKLIQYVQDSIKKLEEDFNEFYLKEFNKRYTTLFDKWFILAYFYSIGIPYTDKRLSKETVSRRKIADDDLVVALKTYTNNIQELSQNVIYHTGDKEGYLYVAYIKKEDLSKNTIEKNNNFVSIDTNVKRFVEFAIMDFASKGIVDTFKERPENKTEGIELINFFELEPTKTINLTSLDMRYAAHLGLKTFVASIKGQSGYFYVESNNNSTKSKVELCNGYINEVCSPDFIDGTHFHVVVPVSKIEGLISAPKSQSSAESFIQQFKEILNDGNNIKVSGTDLSSLLRLSNATEIEDRNNEIKYLGDRIAAEEYLIDEKKREIAIKIPDNDGSLYIIQNVYRLINYLQLSLNNNYFTTIVLTNLSNEFVYGFEKLFKTHVLVPNLSPIWKNDCAVVLMSKELNYRIISGEEESDIIALNNELKKHYCISTNYPSSEPTMLKKELKCFVRPYELLIDNNKYFYSYVDQLLRKCIEDKEQGYCVRHENTYIGSKMIVVSYYEAETLFQNSFFAERFAFLIAQKLKNTLKSKQFVVNEDLYIVGAGYHSDLTIRSLRSLLSNKPKTMLAIDGEEIDFLCSIKPNHDSKFIIITPIGSTLSYHDKIAAFLMRKFSVSKDNIVHHCVIVVGNKNLYENNQGCFHVFSKESDDHKADIEYTFKWDNIDIRNKQINIKYKNVEKVDYDILIGHRDKRVNRGNWHHRIDENITFPPDYEKEEYVNQTENQSINSQNLLGFPKLNKTYLVHSNHSAELKRLKELVQYIYYGHIENHHTHYRYYIHSEEFVAKEKVNPNSNLSKWILDLKRDSLFQDSDGCLNLIITPNAKIESEFVNCINQEVFCDNAQVINIDAHSWKNNMAHKYKYIGDIVKNNKSVKFHYVDHALLTANTYLKTKRFLEEITEEITEDKTQNKFSFSSVIVLINRVSPNVTDDIATKDGFRAFFNLFVPESTDSISDCVLCALVEFYKGFHAKTLSSDCDEIIVKNESKIKKTTFGEVKKKKSPIDDKKQLRLLFTHELFYRIANINESQNISAFEKFKSTKQMLDKFYSFEMDEFCTKWGSKKYNKIDQEISFVKVISSPPLTRFIAVREYAHLKLLDILKDQLEKKTEDCDLDALKLLKAVLKSLSFLNSTALVRKAVIIGSWRMFDSVFTTEVDNLGFDQIKNISLKDIVNNKNEELNSFIKTNQTDLFFQDEMDEAKNKKNRLSTLLEMYRLFPKELYFNIKNAILEDETKSMFLNELLRTGEECLSMERLKENVAKKADFQVMLDAGSAFSDEVKLQYEHFLEWIYYDTTTVLQKALENFEKETIKEEIIKDAFYFPSSDEDYKKWGLSEYDKAITKETIQLFRDKVVGEGNEVEYYYENLKLFIFNAEKIDYIDKLVRVLYAKLKLERLVDSKTDNSQTKIEDDIKIILTILSDIMDSDSTFIIFKHNKEEFYEFHKFADGDRYKCGRVYDCKPFMDDFSFANPFEFSKKTINNQNYNCECARIDDQSVLYFAYNNGGETIEISKAQKQLMLLLRNNLNSYVKIIRNNGLLDVWIEKQRTNEFFTERYRKNTHNALGNLNTVSNNIFDGSRSIDFDYVQLYAILADLHIGKIHNSLLVGIAEDYKQECIIFKYVEIKDSIDVFLKCAKAYLAKYEITNFTTADFNDILFYYTDSLPFLLFQFIHNISKNTQSGYEKDCKVSIYVEKDYLVIQNSYSTIDDEALENIRKSLSLTFNNDILKDHISLFCINYFCMKIREKGLDITTADRENTFIVKIPIIKTTN